MINATTDTKQCIIKNSTEITQVFDRTTDQGIEHVNYAILPASQIVEIASYKNIKDDEEVLGSDLILPFAQAKILKNLLNNPHEEALLKAFLNRPDVSTLLN